MKTFTFRYDSRASMDGMFDRFKKAAAAAAAAPRKNAHEVVSNSVSVILSAMTAGKIELFYAIARNKPDSIYRLAQMLERDTANVLRDTKVLAGLGLVTLKSERVAGRDRVRPIANYDRILFDFGEADVAKPSDAA